MASRKKTAPRFDLKYVLLCEEVRSELGAKMSLLGFYGGDTIVVSTSPAVMRGLAFVFSFDVLRGTSPRTATFWLVGPNGRPVPQLTIPLTPSATGKRKNVVVQTGGLEIEAGEYTAVLAIENQELTTTFSVRSDAEFIQRLRSSEAALPLP